MDNMTEKIRESIRIELAKKRWNQTDLSENANLSRQQVSYLMNEGGSLSEGWQKIFDALGLEVIVVPKSSSTVLLKRGE